MTNRIKTILVLISWAIISSGQAQAADGAVIQIRNEAETEIMWFREGAELFTNRNYRLTDCPKQFEDKKFLNSSIDKTHFDVVEDGSIIILTPVSIPKAASQAAKLKELGFNQITEKSFQLFGNKDINKVHAYKKDAVRGQSYRLGKWVVVLGFEKAVSSLTDRTCAAKDKPFYILPEDIPNTGKLFVDREKLDKSGHGNNSITECKNGDVISFYSMTGTGKDNWNGHGVAGWSEYRRSTDGGLTWGKPVVFEYSKQMYNSDELCSALVYSLETAPNGTLIATVIRYGSFKWTKKLPPVYFLSYDNGRTWEGPREFDKSAKVEDIAYTMNTSFVHDGEVFIVFRGGESNMSPGGQHTLWVSEDNGESFSQRSVLPFEHTNYYWAAGAIDNGEIIVYSYNAHHRKDDKTAEKNLPYVISKDGGRTWSSVKTAYFAKGIRNPQLSGKIGGLYFIHGRSGSFNRELIGDDIGKNSLILYSSKDGINWDNGIALMSRRQHPGGGDCYSVNEIIGKYDEKKPETLLIQSSISYDGTRVNSCHWRAATSPEALETLK